MSVSESVHVNSLDVPDFPLLSRDRAHMLLGINRLAYPREKSLTLEILRLTRDIELEEEHEDVQGTRLPIVYVQRKWDGWYSRLYIKKTNETSYDISLFQKNLARIPLSEILLRKIEGEVKKLKLHVGVTIIDCELCHA